MSASAPIPQNVYVAHRGKLICAVAILMFISWASATGRSIDPVARRLSIAAAIVVLVLALCIAYMALRRLPRLHLHQAGFTLHSGLGERSYAWTDVYDFHVRNVFIGVDSIVFRRRGYGKELAILSLFSAPTGVIVDALEKGTQSGSHAA